jgi:hypothetical protein
MARYRVGNMYLSQEEYDAYNRGNGRVVVVLAIAAVIALVWSDLSGESSDHRAAPSQPQQAKPALKEAAQPRPLGNLQRAAARVRDAVAERAVAKAGSASDAQIATRVTGHEDKEPVLQARVHQTSMSNVAPAAGLTPVRRRRQQPARLPDAELVQPTRRAVLAEPRDGLESGAGVENVPELSRVPQVGPAFAESVPLTNGRLVIKAPPFDGFVRRSPLLE